MTSSLLTFACGECGAQPGEACRGTGAATTYHAARYASRLSATCGGVKVGAPRYEAAPPVSVPCPTCNAKAGEVCEGFEAHEARRLAVSVSAPRLLDLVGSAEALEGEADPRLGEMVAALDESIRSYIEGQVEQCRLALYASVQKLARAYTFRADFFEGKQAGQVVEAPPANAQARADELRRVVLDLESLAPGQTRSALADAPACACALWARDASQLLTKHHSLCAEYEAELRGLIEGLYKFAAEQRPLMLLPDAEAVDETLAHAAGVLYGVTQPQTEPKGEQLAYVGVRLPPLDAEQPLPGSRVLDLSWLEGRIAQAIADSDPDPRDFEVVELPNDTEEKAAEITNEGVSHFAQIAAGVVETVIEEALGLSIVKAAPAGRVVLKPAHVSVEEAQARNLPVKVTVPYDALHDLVAFGECSCDLGARPCLFCVVRMSLHALTGHSMYADEREGAQADEEPERRSLVIRLDLNETGGVRCHLNTNGLPFEEVRDQLVAFVAALQWQLDDEHRCPFYKTPAGASKVVSDISSGSAWGDAGQSDPRADVARLHEHLHASGVDVARHGADRSTLLLVTGDGPVGRTVFDESGSPRVEIEPGHERRVYVASNIGVDAPADVSREATEHEPRAGGDESGEGARNV